MKTPVDQSRQHSHMSIGESFPSLALSPEHVGQEMPGPLRLLLRASRVCRLVSRRNRRGVCVAGLRRQQQQADQSRTRRKTPRRASKGSEGKGRVRREARSRSRSRSRQHQHCCTCLFPFIYQFDAEITLLCNIYKPEKSSASWNTVKNVNEQMPNTSLHVINYRKTFDIHNKIF